MKKQRYLLVILVLMYLFFPVSNYPMKATIQSKWIQPEFDLVEPIYVARSVRSVFPCKILVGDSDLMRMQVHIRNEHNLWRALFYKLIPSKEEGVSDNLVIMGIHSLLVDEPLERTFCFFETASSIATDVIKVSVILSCLRHIG